MATQREEAAPSFPAWKRTLETAPEDRLASDVERFIEVLKTVGTPLIEGAAVSFVAYEPDAHEVTLAGEFNDWGRTGRSIAMSRLPGTGIFYHTLTLNEPARLEYKLVVDGEWKTDSFCPNTVDNGVGGRNSFFDTGDFRDLPELQWAPDTPHGRVEQFAFTSERLGNGRQVHVYLPSQYDKDPTARFPSLYVHDGGEYLERASLAVVLDNLIHDGAIPPLITIMIDPVNRMLEYWANDAYAEFLCIDFVPEMDRCYRTLDQRNSRGVMGASLGGLISVYAALSHPSVFSKIGGQSSALHLAEDKLVARVGGLKRIPMRFYFDVGKFEPPFIPAHQRFAALLKTNRLPCLYQELPGGHNWTSWRAHLKDLLAFLFTQARTKRTMGEESKSSRFARKPRRGEDGR